ncbi:phosphotransferase family protein [Deinococcus aquiradiocola]|uniref:Aminoglycoside phosphotransferase n=1 Tax=Deinococcus aquiradiocola TaxID=393059 RepID=A0A917PQQ3_9DEIO|nr:phosphotransferase family protein [Deinococcus aquiradiocola]GGJ87465.1 aminoglycoside phosphotransferase [Deinococcus aquiradiocola]
MTRGTAPAAPDTAPVRTGEELDTDALRAYLSTHLPGGAEGVSLAQFPGGHSNLTYWLQVDAPGGGTAEYVLRRAPMGPVAPKAHDMVREYHLLSRIHPVFPPAPAPVLLCEDTAVLGTPFFLMERRRGVVARTDVPAEYQGLPDAPRHMSEALADTLAQLHAIDIVAAGLDGLGKPQGFNRRQVEGWAGRWQRAETDPTPDAADVAGWLLANVPEESAHTLVHNDYKLDNLMLDAADPRQVVALLDWEMTAIGDPLVDLGLTLCYWTQRGFPPSRQIRLGAGHEGFFSREEFLARYARQSGRDLSRIGWYEVLGVFKLAVIVQQIYARYRAGQTRDPRFAVLGEQAQSLMTEAARQIAAGGA